MFDREKLREIKTFPSLVKYLRDELDWPVEADDFETITFDYEPEELGIDAKTAAKIEEIKQLRPLVTNQPWGIFFVKFEPKRLPVVVLRRILSRLVMKKRASARKPDMASWSLDDLLFISNYGEGGERQITFAHFAQNEQMGDLPTLKVLGWDDEDTVLHIYHVHQELKEKLHWPTDENDLDGWREKWSSAFFLRHREVIRTSKDLAVRLADLARRIHRRANQVLAVETEHGPLRRLHKAFKEALIHDLEIDDFADMYAQTITYGLLAARVSRPLGIIAENVADMVPITNPFLKEMLSTFLSAGGRKGKMDFDELGVREVVDLLNSPDTHMEAVLRDFGNRTRQEDPVIHFYELFLAEYDKKLKVERGIFYTPQPVVSYIVRSVHEILQKEFGLEDGLADITTWGEMAKKNPDIKIPDGVLPDEPFVNILDVATGTATFLVEVIDVIHKTMMAKWKKQGLTEKQLLAAWNEYVPKHLLPRLYGFELMMAPYAIAHMKLGLKLFETGYHFGSNERVRVYLTNSLESPPQTAGTNLADLFSALGQEAQAVNTIKRQKHFTVVVGNPPYSAWSANLTPQTRAIVERYKFIGNERIRERGALQFEKNLQDDYVKFFAWSEKTATALNVGVLSLITNNGFLDTPTLRGMRWHLLNSFHRLHFLNLHGSTKRPIEGDKNVFDIQQGVSISVLVRTPNSKSPMQRVFRFDLIGSREYKYKVLGSTSIEKTAWEPISPLAPLFQFIELDSGLQTEYHKYMPLPEVMPFYSSGTETGFDSLLVDLSSKELLTKIRSFIDPNKTDNQIETDFSIGEGTAKKLLKLRKEFNKDFNSHGAQYVTRGMYRVFDSRYYYYKKEYFKTNSFKVMQHLLSRRNLALVAFRQQSQEGFHHIFVTSELGDKNAVSLRTREINYYFPLRLFDSLTFGNDSQINFSSSFLKTLAKSLNLDQPRLQGLPKELSPEEIINYAYAVFHSSGYRIRYAEFLKTDFPRLPLTTSLELFWALSRIGGELVALHLMESPKLDKYLSKFVGKSDNEVVKVRYEDETVWINSTQGFQGVSQDVWDFYIGGYQVCEKWLKDRKGRTLSNEDITHYHKIVVAIAETIRLMTEIDDVIEKHGGWPGAFTSSQVQMVNHDQQERIILPLPS